VWGFSSSTTPCRHQAVGSQHHPRGRKPTNSNVISLTKTSRGRAYAGIWHPSQNSTNLVGFGPPKAGAHRRGDHFLLRVTYTRRMPVCHATVA